MGLISAELLNNSQIISFPMPEDTRVQQQVHMHIWMEADIIMPIVSDARWAVKTTLDLLAREFCMERIKKSTVRDAWFRPGGCRTKGYPGVRCHQACENTRPS